MANRPKRERTRHIRRPDQQAHGGAVRIGCDCGFEAFAQVAPDGQPLSGGAIRHELERLFVAHLAHGERRAYLLIDQRLEEIESDGGVRQMVPRGNFIMPSGEPCLLSSWREADDVRWGRWLIPESGESGELPVGEIRTADNRVFRLDCPA